MKKVLSLIMMASFIVVGCAETGPFGAIPKKPPVETQRGKDCVNDCDDQHAQCFFSCEKLRWDRKGQCRSQCYEVLKECYRLCSEDYETAPPKKSQ